ncbi:MAG: hypothetical protein ACI31R_00900 [Bacilli bacterium]
MDTNNKPTSNKSSILDNTTPKTKITKAMDNSKYVSPISKALQEYNDRNNHYADICRRLGSFAFQIQNPLKQYKPYYDNLKMETLISGISRAAEINQLVEDKMSKTLKHIVDIIDFNSITKSLTKSLTTIGEILKQYDFSSISRIHGHDVSLLKRFYWVIPFEYEYTNLSKLSKYETRIEFEKYILKYFNENRVKRIFIKIRKQCKNKDKKELIRQIEKSFNNGDYAICITSLITLLDGLTLELIEPNSDKQHLSYRVINDMLEYIGEKPLNEYSYELYLKVEILNNFYDKLYDDEENFKTTNRSELSRHINSHGVKYLNDKIEVLRLLNTIYYCQEIIKETELQEQFTRTKKDKKFSKIEDKVSK